MDSTSTFHEELAEVYDEQLQELKLVASERTINILRAAVLQDEDYQQLIKQIRHGWTDPVTSPALTPYETFADELTVCGDLAFKGDHVIVPVGAREDILQWLHRFIRA